MRGIIVVACLAFLASLSGGCSHAHHGHGVHDHGPVVVHKPGPPAHAPAHGHRRKHADPHHGVEMVFDPGLGVYVVVGMEGIYFHADYFYRILDGDWHRSTRVDHGWALVSQERSLPPGLAKKHRKAHKRGKKGGGYPANYGH